MKLDLVSVFIFLSITQGLFVIFMMWTTVPVSRWSRGFLTAVILVLTWYQVEFLLIRSKVDLDLPMFYGTRYGSWLLLGPLLWFYSRAYFSREFQFSWRASFHFVPFLIFYALVPLFNVELLTWRSVDYGMLTVFDDWNQNPITFPQYLYGSIFLFQFIHALVYVFLSLRLVNELELGLKENYSNYDEVNIRWHKLFLYLTTIILVAVTSFILYQFITQDYRRMSDYFYVLPMTIVVYMLLYHAIKYPNLIFKHSISTRSDKYEKSSLASSAAVEYAQKLQDLIESRKLYLQRELGLNDLAKELEVSTHHLSQSINETLNQNFYELINQYRVEEAKNKIKNESEKSLLQVAFEVGFNNKASFNNAFKKHVGMTPSRYRETA